MNWIKTFWNLEFPCGYEFSPGNLSPKILRATELYLFCKVVSVLHSWPQIAFSHPCSQWFTNNLNTSILICSLETWRASEISKFFKLGRFLWQWVDYSEQNKLLRYHMSCCIIDTFCHTMDLQEIVQYILYHNVSH